MTEREWLVCEDAKAMLDACEVIGGRKLQLFACACAFGEVNNVGFGNALSFHEEARVAEFMADGLPSPYQRHQTWYWSWVCASNARNAAEYAALCPNNNTNSKPALLREIVGNPFRPFVYDIGCFVHVVATPLIDRSKIAFYDWVRWNTPAVVGLARAIYEERDFGLMPILHDALHDAGCRNEDILNHCRGLEACLNMDCASINRTRTWECKACGGTGFIPLRGPHVRGCWVLDLILGKK